MGLVFIEGRVKASGREQWVNLLLDSGVTYTVLRRDIWEKLGLTPKRQVELILADGTTITRALSEAVL